MKRKEFIQTSGMAALAASLPFNDLLAAPFYKKLPAVGIQLWTVKENMMKDPKATLKNLSDYGFKQIESFEGPKGIFWGMKNTEYKAYLNDLGMTPVSSHCDNTKDFERKAAEAAEIGIKYLICAYKGPQKSIENFKKFTDEFNACGEIARKNGIRFAYHNHDYSFKTLDGQVPQTLMMEGTDPNLVDFEMDIYWVVAARENPEEWFKRYPNRWRLCHIKDRKANGTGFESCQVGQGDINFAQILKTGKANGLQYFISEQEAFTGSNPLESSQANAAYLKKLSI